MSKMLSSGNGSENLNDFDRLKAIDSEHLKHKYSDFAMGH